MHVLVDYRSKCALSGLSFEHFKNNEILDLSVKEITNPYALDRLLNPVTNGLYDLALGPLDKNDICLTCGLDYYQCAGHFGHINLVLPLYNPVFFRELVKLLRSSCLSCHQLLTTKFEKDYFYAQMTLAKNGLIEQLPLVDDLYKKILSNTDAKLISRVSFRKDFDDLLIQIMSEHREELRGEVNHDSYRNVIRSKIDILKEFMDHKLKASRQTCPNCMLPLRQLRAEHNSKLFYAKGVSARALKKNKLSHVSVKFTKQNEEEQIPVDEMDQLDIQLDSVVLDTENSKTLKNNRKANDISLNDELEQSEDEEEKLENLTGQTYLTPIEARKFLQMLFDNDKETIQLMFSLPRSQEKNDTELFFFDSIAVPPSKYRPVSQFKEQRFENSQTSQLSKLLQQNIILKDILNEIISATKETIIEDSIVSLNKLGKRAPSLQEKLQSSWLQMQSILNVLYDSDLDKINTDKPAGLKQLLEKKEGLFRKHMMGKRVNYAGRSVISPDVFISTDEIGIPEVFAKKLTYPQPVNSVNFWEMKQLVLNGPDQYPGACLVEYGNGNVIRLKGKDYESRLAIAKQLLTPESSIDSNLDIKIVHRHLKNGDVLLFNRQPTLHRPSVMAHKARVLPGEKTLRMHYSNCKAYNADFDGDEMNAHLPQNEIARSEALNLMLSSEHYLVPKDGTPLGGLIHDHVVSGVALTMRGRFFDKMDYQFLVYNSFNAVRQNIKLLPPAIIKPKPLWTGKQTWYREAETREPNWSSSKNKRSYLPHLMSESYVLIRHGHLLVGVLDKAHYGSSSYSLVHCCFELYGGSIAGQLLTCFGRLFTTFLQLRGFTLGVEDILLKSNVPKSMSKIMKKARKSGYEILAQVFAASNIDNKKYLTERYQRTHLNPDESYMKEIDLAYKGSVDSFQNSLTNLCFPNGLIKKFPHNNLQLMIQSGAKGSTVNSMQMSCLLGQQELEGRRPRLMPNGNTLPSFLPYDPSPNSGGFISNSFMAGLTPQEYFFHCMAGREGLVDTAVKTSRSGYLQRCLIKHLEGIVVNYDLTVRDSDNSVIQFQYGEDSLAVEKIPFLNEKQFPFLIDNYPILTSNRNELEKIRKICHHELIDKKIKKTKEWKKSVQPPKAADSNLNDGVGERWSPFLNFSKMMSAHESLQNKTYEEKIQHIISQWKAMSDEEKKVYKKGKFKRRLPITAAHNPDRYLGAVSERIQEVIDDYIEKNEKKFTDAAQYSAQTSLSYRIEKENFKELIYLKSLKSCISPGDSVGILAAQSIGEPSTQMTLNTFHFAGRGDMNVTLGIPRLREILMVASANIKTPSMQVPVFDSKIARAEKLKENFERVNFENCLHRIDIEQKLNFESKEEVKRIWSTRVKFEFLPTEEMRQRTNTSIKPFELFYYVESKFIKNLCVSINKKYNQISSSSLLHASTVRDKSMKNFKNINTENGDDDENGDGEVDKDVAADVMESGEAYGEKLLSKADDELEYVGEDEEEKQLNQNENEESIDEDEENMGDIREEDENEDNETAAVNIKKEQHNDIQVLKKKTKKVNLNRVNKILSISDMIESYSYDAENMKWFEITFKLDALKPRLDLYSVIQKEIKNSYITKVEGIKRCFLNQSTLPEDKGCFKLITEGINVMELAKHSDVLDVSKLYLNDIHCMASKFGVEAAVKVIINEMKQVFNAYGINVDYRHLSLIADYMTFEGTYKPFNRLGIKSNASPLQKMSFETCLQFFKDACLYGQHENLKTPSACLVTGRMVNAGTGKFDILTRLI